MVIICQGHICTGKRIGGGHQPATVVSPARQGVVLAPSGGQAARFGPFGRVGGQEQGGLLLVLDPAQDGGQFAQGQGATAVGRLDDGRQARGVQIIDRAILFPRTNRRIGPFDPRLAQAQARRARGGRAGRFCRVGPTMAPDKALCRWPLRRS